MSPSLAEALLNIVPKNAAGAQPAKKGGQKWWVANPVNPKENFADKCGEN
jgi:hypothetical protein